MADQVIQMQPQANGQQMTVAPVEQKQEQKQSWVMRLRGGGAGRDCCMGLVECFLCFECCKGLCECFADIVCCPCEMAGC
ncbi:hypothetical protein CALCODRAFT_485954 [Calocera cornea HHB12733]|uniref:Uncharacterized protein n=1 Tax=Calocera cornea HHB12733 TaxID=1353952 RepID=A0A165E226_9BASI|nr:hypothetical protein CALCODRAFT_485954 [Calocera cornea HHB12733]